MISRLLVCSGRFCLLCVRNHGIPGDPQSAVGNLGDIVLFVQLATARFKVTDQLIWYPKCIQGHQISDTLKHNNKLLDMNFLRRTDTILTPSVLTPEETRALKTWFKALFDKNSEGIEDGVLR